MKFCVEEFRDIICAASGGDRAFMDEIYESETARKYVMNDSNFLDKVRAGGRPPQRLFTNPTPQASAT